MSTAKPKPRDEKILAFHDNFSYRLTVLYLLMAKTTAGIYAEEDLTSNQWKVMSVLYHFAPLPASEILKWSTLDKATISRTIQMLLQQKLVSRELNQSDARSVDVKLTAKGLEKYSRMGHKVTALQESLFEGLSAEDERTLFAMLDKVEQRLKTPDADAAA